MGVYYTDDPVADFDRYDADRARAMARLPKCRLCREPLPDSERSVQNERVCKWCAGEEV